MLNFVYLFRSFNFFKEFKWKGLTGPIIILIILSMMILPLPAFVLDIFFTFNISFSIIILLVTMFTRNTLEFSVFPTVLLFSTLFRLALNVASTRIILLKGHIGLFAAGHVIEAFGQFLVGGDFTIGIVVFIILVIINFMVITKGAGRIAEVGARFVLDGMPGKQMAVDSDLHTGLINERQAKKRRIEIVQEADFYGSMDGASKFVRGDAIAGILIMIVNILGGLIIGVIRHNMLLSEAGKVYTLLTIGDGLVAQIPALVISIAAGVIVTRVSTNQNVSEQMISQIFYNPITIVLSSLVLGFLGFIPGMPNMIFLLFTILLLSVAWLIHNFKNKNFDISLLLGNSKSNIYRNKKKFIVSWNDVILEDIIRLEMGKFLLPMIELKKESDLYMRISAIRRKVAKDIGFLPPEICIQNNFNLSNSVYRILIKGVEYGKGEIFCNKLMAINSGDAIGVLLGQKVFEPVFGLSAFWIDNKFKEQAKNQKYTIATPELIITTHLNNIIFSNLKDFFSRQEAQQLLEYVSLKIPKLTEELIPNLMNLTTFHKVLQNLLLESIPIRDMRTILETLIEYSVICKNANELTSVVRLSLSKLITQTFFFEKNEIYVIGIEKELEDILSNIVESGHDDIEPELSEIFLKNTAYAIEQHSRIYEPVVLLVKHSLRSFISFFLRKYFFKLIILSYLEISDEKIITITNFISKNKIEYNI